MASKQIEYSWSKSFAEIKNKHDEAFMAIDEAISLEEHERPQQAVVQYNRGVSLIDEALAIPIQCPDEPDATWQKACSMIGKMKQTKREVLLRINSIQQSSGFVSSEAPPSYDEAMASSSTPKQQTPLSYKELAAVLNEIVITPDQQELIYTHDNVRVYFIASDGEVASTLKPETLNIFLLGGNEPNAPKAIIEVGTFRYPLIPGVTPCYHSNYGAFVLPDLNSPVPGSSVGLILPPEEDKDVFDLLESILSEVIKAPVEPGEAEQPEDYSTKVSNHIVDGAFYVSQNLIKGAMKAGEFINRTTPKIIERMSGSQQPSTVSKPLLKTMKIAEKTTSTAANITGFVTEKVSYATVKLGQFLAPHIKKQGTRLLTSGFKVPEKEAENRMNTFLTITAGAFEGFSTLYSGLESSAYILGKNLKDNTVKIVNHRYGQSAGTLTDDALSTVTNVYSIAHNSKVLTPKGLAKNTIKGAGKGVIQDYTSHRASTTFGKMPDNNGKINKECEISDTSDTELSKNEKLENNKS